MSKLLLFFLASALISTAFAGTVTLTGTCSAKLNPNNTINFSISNSGTESASNLFIASFPAFSGKQTGYYSANQIAPGQHSMFSINATQGNMTGTFIYYFVATYAQGMQIFTVVFPCTVKNSDTYPSTIGISNLTVDYVNSTSAKIAGSIYSFSQQQVSGNLTVIVPPMFRNAGEKMQFSVGPYQYSNFTFYIGPQNQQNATYSGAVALEYSQNGINYAALSVMAIKPYPQQQDPLKEYAIQAASLLIILALIALAVRQRILKRRKKVR